MQTDSHPDRPERIARELHERDPSAQMFGIELVSADLDAATVRMTVRPDMCNGFGMLHGGMTFLLADTAMAFASCDGERGRAGDVGRDRLARPRGDRSGAHRHGARQRAVSGRTTWWDVTVEADDGDQTSAVALFRGTDATRRVGAVVE